MDPLIAKVASRFLTAGLGDEFEVKMHKLLAYAPSNPPPHEVEDFRKWLVDNFHFQTRTTPKGLKREKEALDRLWRTLATLAGPGLMPGAAALMLQSMWERDKAMVPTWVSAFSSVEGKATAVTREKAVGGNTYVNMVGANDAKFDTMIAEIEGVFGSLRGWRQGALSGGVTVHLAGPKDFRGTASGKYNESGDVLWIRATSGGRIERAGTGYGGFGYVITHELGHRYERKHHVKYDFDRGEWHTSRYSATDGEAFAELFAISNFGLTGAWAPGIVERFEKLMS